MWKFLTKPSRFAGGAVIAVGVFLGILLWGGFNWTLELTNTETFCLTCHEMEQNVYREFTGTVHDTNASGVRATCPDCHVPRPWIHKLVRKVYATNELYHHFRGTVSTRQKFDAERLTMAKRVWTVMKETDSRECRNCHDFLAMDVTEQEARARAQHLDAKDRGMTCIDCHKGVAHDLPEGALEAIDELNGKWFGSDG